MRIYPEQDIQDTIAACKKAAVSFDNRFYTTDKRLEGLLLKAATIIGIYHNQSVAQQQTVAESDGTKLDVILEYTKQMSTDITALNTAIATLTTAYQTQHTAISEMIAKNQELPQPADFSQQINNINNVIGQVNTDDASINAILQPVTLPDPTATSQVPPTPAQAAVTGNVSATDAGASTSAPTDTTPSTSTATETSGVPTDASAGVIPADSATTPPPATS